MLQEDLESLEGWLCKKKSREQFSLFAKDNKRWFKICKLSGDVENELALCYYKSPKDSTPRGWVYLADVTSIEESEDRCFTLFTPSRVLQLQAQSPAEFKLWIHCVVNNCVTANISKVKSAQRVFASDAKEAPRRNELSEKETPSPRFDETLGSHRADRKHRNKRNDENSSQDIETSGVHDQDRSSTQSTSSDSRGKVNVAHRRDRDDRRGQVYRSGHGTGLSSRLNEYIRGDFEQATVIDNAKLLQNVSDKSRREAKEDLGDSVTDDKVTNNNDSLTKMKPNQLGTHSDLETYPVDAKSAEIVRHQTREREPNESESDESDEEMPKPANGNVNGTVTTHTTAESKEDLIAAESQQAQNKIIVTVKGKSKAPPMSQCTFPMRRSRDTMPELSASATTALSTQQKSRITDDSDEDADFKMEMKRYNREENSVRQFGKAPSKLSNSYTKSIKSSLQDVDLDESVDSIASPVVRKLNNVRTDVN